jgi:hypothetical protein
MEARRRGPLTSSSSDSNSSSVSSDSEDSDSSSADSGFAKTSLSDTEADFTPSAPSLEEIEFGRKVIGLSGRARWRVRKLLAVLTRMRKNLPPSARIEAVRRLGWRLGPGLEASRASAEDFGPEPTRVPEGGDQIRKFLEEWQQKYKESEERYRTERDEAFRSDDELAHAEERLAVERTAELENRAKMVEQRLPAITARLNILRGEVTGSSRPVPSEVQLTSTGTEMTTEEHVATKETHLRYAEGHLQPSEEHLAGAEVHLKLVKAHLTALVAMEPVEVEPPETAALPPPESVGDEASTDQDGATPEEKDRSPIARPRAGPAQQGSGSDGKALRPGAGECWVCAVSKCQDSAAHPLDECGGFKDLSVSQRRKVLKEWGRCECCLTDCRDRKNGSRCYRRIGFRRHPLLGLVSQARVDQAESRGRRQQQSQGKTAGGGQSTPRGKSGQVGSGRGQGQRILPRRQTDTWCFPAFGKDRELVWLKATRSQHVSVTRMTHQAAVRLGFAQSVTEAYQVQLRLSREPQFILRAEGIETLECIRSRSERGGARALQPDVIIGWPDWGKVQPFTISGWAIPGQAFLEATAPATRWHLRMNQKGGPPKYLNVKLEPMRKRSTITHEAAVRIGMPYEPFYMLFARAEDGEVRNFVAV